MKKTDMFHYTMCGLDNIYLLNGFVRENTEYGSGVSIKNIDGLNKAIARNLINAPRRLLPKEYRFLRKEMGCSQASFALTIGVDEQTIARVEKGEIAPPKVQFEAVFRALAAEVVLKEKSEMKAMLAEITKIENDLFEENKRIILESKDDSWIQLKQKQA